MWRVRHYKVVARIIGDAVVGTQGTPVEVLGRLIHKVFFPELWQVRNELTALSKAAPPVTPREEVTGLLQALIRLDTVNPPGNETRAAELLRDYLARNGVESTLYAKVPERANLVARLPGGDGPTLALICHTDTVLADPAEWHRDPWSGDLVDDVVWGRGALDMKGHVAAGRSHSHRSRGRGSARPATCLCRHGRRGGR